MRRIEMLWGAALVRYEGPAGAFGMVTYNRRRHRRISTYGLTIQLQGEEGPRPCIVENLSTGGVFLRCSELSPVGSEVQLTLTRPGMKRAVRITGRVASALDTNQLVGMGIEFRSVEPEDVARLASLLVDLGAVEGKAPSMPRPEGPPTTIANAHPPLPAPSGVSPGGGKSPKAAAPALTVSGLERRVKSLEEELALTRAKVEEKERALARFRTELDRVRLELKGKEDQLMKLGGKKR